MTLSATQIDAWPLAARISSAIGSPNVWQVVIGDTGCEGKTADALLLELKSLYDGPIRRVAVLSADDLTAINADREDLLVLVLESQWTRKDWRTIDLRRSRLRRDGMTVLIVGADDVAEMVVAAPNLWSWVGGMVWKLEEGSVG